MFTDQQVKCPCQKYHLADTWAGVEVTTLRPHAWHTHTHTHTKAQVLNQTTRAHTHTQSRYFSDYTHPNTGQQQKGQPREAGWRDEPRWDYTAGVALLRRRQQTTTSAEQLVAESITPLAATLVAGAAVSSQEPLQDYMTPRRSSGCSRPLTRRLTNDSWGWIEEKKKTKAKVEAGYLI